MKEIFSLQNSPPFLAKFLLIRHWVCAGICQRAAVDESGIIKKQLGKYSRSENGRSAWGALYDTAT
jgi:hypothetical protein